jgi:pilus assembly protein TadC
LIGYSSTNQSQAIAMLIYSIYHGAFSQQYFIALLTAVIVGTVILLLTWHQSPYGRKRSVA